MIFVEFVLNQAIVLRITGREKSKGLNSLFLLTLPIKDEITWKYCNFWMQIWQGGILILTVILGYLYSVVIPQPIGILSNRPTFIPVHLVINYEIWLWQSKWLSFYGKNLTCLWFQSVDQKIFFVIMMWSIKNLFCHVLLWKIRINLLHKVL